MIFKLNTLYKAIDKLKDEVNGWKSMHPDADVNVVLHEEDLQDGKFIAHMTLTCTVTNPPTQYDASERTITRTIEIFPANENRPTRLSVAEIKELKD